MRAIASACAAAALAGCATMPPPPRPFRYHAGVRAIEYFPLSEGSAWSYDVDSGEAETTLTTQRVVEVRARRVRVQSGATAMEYELRDDGIFAGALDAYVLKEPIVVGTRWELGHGGTARISSVSRMVQAVGTTFRDCVEVIAHEEVMGRTVVTVFAPRVGPVLIESSLTAGAEGRSARVRALLRGFAIGE